jgi:hypothetical protein
MLTLPDRIDNLQGQWLFHTDPYEVGENQGWQQPGFDDSTGWRTIVVPGYWEPQGVTDPRPGQPPKPKIGVEWTDYDGVAWYRLRFVVPKEWAGQDLVLHVGSIDDEDRTYFNGKLIGQTGQGLPNAATLVRRYQVPASMVNAGAVNVLAIRVLDNGGPGGIPGAPVFLLPVKMLKSKMQLPQSDAPLAVRFADPPAPSRILRIIHSWPNNADEQNILIRTLIDQGFGGVVSNVSFTDYLQSEDRWKDYVRAITEAKKAGMSLWFYDERGYPSGTAGGLTLQGHPEWEVRGLLQNDTVTDGGSVHLDVPSGRLVFASAYPEKNGQIDPAKAVDLSSLVKDGSLSWQAPTGHWRVMAVTEDQLFDHTANALSVGSKLPYINLLMKEPTARFIQLTHQAYASHLGDDLGKYFVSTFTDEPSLMNTFFAGSSYRALPWAPNLPIEFEKRRGYALEPVLPLLLAAAGSRGRKVKYDFWQTISELVSENYFGQLQDFCHKHNFKSGGHLLLEEPIAAHVGYYGSYYKCVHRMDVPGIDCLTSMPDEVPWFIARMVSSIAELDGKKLTMCETSDFVQTYRPSDDNRPPYTVSEAQIRGTCNRLIFGGISNINSYYTFRGASIAELRRINEWVGRCSTMLTGGHRAADIAVLYPIESIWPKFIPARNGPTDEQSANLIQQTNDSVTSSLYTSARDFSYLDEPGVENSRVDRGALVHGDLRWRVLILPQVDTLPIKAWEKLSEYYRSGGVVIAVGSLPENSATEFPSARVRSMAEKIFGHPTNLHVSTNSAGGAAIFIPNGAESMLPLVLDAVLERDVRLPARSPIRATHRRVEGHEVYFLINDSNSPWEGSVDLSAGGKGELWDPATGRVSPLASSCNIKLKFPAYGGTLLRFASARLPQRLKATAGSIPEPKLVSLPIVQPNLSAGEFVHGTVTTAETHAASPAWQAKATITKSKVDTFCMLAFQFAKPLDLRNVDYLRLDMNIPERQTASVSLLLMVGDKSGGQSYVDTGISLASPGHHLCAIQLNRLQPTPWLGTSAKQVDLSDVSNLVVGWGGYHGTEGEKVDFSVSLPRMGMASGSDRP